MGVFLNILLFLLSSLLIWFIAKAIWRLIQYVVFRSIIDKIIIKIVEDDDDSTGERLPNSYTEDDLLQDKNLRKQQMQQEVERMNEQENEFKQQRPKKVIVGFAPNAIVGKWTARIATQMMSKMQNLDPKELQDLGYFRSLVNAQRRAADREIGGINGMKR